MNRMQTSNSFYLQMLFHVSKSSSKDLVLFALLRNYILLLNVLVWRLFNSNEFHFVLNMPFNLFFSMNSILSGRSSIFFNLSLLINADVKELNLETFFCKGIVLKEVSNTWFSPGYPNCVYFFLAFFQTPKVEKCNKRKEKHSEFDIGQKPLYVL